MLARIPLAVPPTLARWHRDRFPYPPPTDPVKSLLLRLSLVFICCLSAGWADVPVRYRLKLEADGAVRVQREGTEAWRFSPRFTVFFRETDPKLAMRPGGVEKVSYNVPTWQMQSPTGPAALKGTRRDVAQAGDGFDDRILEGDTQARTADAFAAAPGETLAAVRWERTGDTIRFIFPEKEHFTLSATITLPAGGAQEPVLAYTLTPRTPGWFSVAYTGAPQVARFEAAEFWQPFLWQERRFPHQSFLTAAFQCPVPATFVRRGEAVVGVVVDAEEFPFEPLPLLENSRFGVALRNPAGDAQPMAFGPVMGGAGSKRAAGEAFTLKLRLYVGQGELTHAYEETARRLYGFRDYRSNAIASLNETLDNMIEYGMSNYSWFIDELKGCAYSTDVPGAVKNVSALNPLNLALVTDDEAIFQQRAYPIAEYLLSREKFLFSLDPEQKIQSPSRALAGPAAPVSELTTLAGITRGASPVFLRLASELMGKTRTLNLDDVSPGDTWQNNLRMYQVTGDERSLRKARMGADAYLASRMEKGARQFESGQFFWTTFTPKWIDLLDLYEATGEKRYLEAARLGARRYTMFTWMAPRIPDELITVNPGGQAPVYWYLKSKGHLPMMAPEEQVPAWRLSEIGLTPESSGTMSGHRGIFMANYAPWMLRIAALTGDALLHDVARSAVVGRYRNFPGYHINTARTTIYEKADYPLRDHKELSVNSFHYNHIWPHMSILLDFLVTDAFARSDGQIDFPSHFIEGYAYLQNKFYGDRPGRFFKYDDAVLWMPRRLMKPGNVELNYLTARGDGRLYVAFTNQSNEAVTTDVEINPAVLPGVAGKSYRVETLAGDPSRVSEQLNNGRLRVTVPPMGLTALSIDGLQVRPKFQHKLLGATPEQAWKQDYLELDWGRARAMVLNFGPLKRSAYVYLQADDSEFREVTLSYEVDGRKQTIADATYPFEFTVDLPPNADSFEFEFYGRTVDGRETRSETAALRR